MFGWFDQYMQDVFKETAMQRLLEWCFHRFNAVHDATNQQCQNSEVI